MQYKTNSEVAELLGMFNHMDKNHDSKKVMKKLFLKTLKDWGELLSKNMEDQRNEMKRKKMLRLISIKEYGR